MQAIHTIINTLGWVSLCTMLGPLWDGALQQHNASNQKHMG